MEGFRQEGRQVKIQGDYGESGEREAGCGWTRDRNRGGSNGDVQTRWTLKPRGRIIWRIVRDSPYTSLWLRVGEVVNFLELHI